MYNNFINFSEFHELSKKLIIKAQLESKYLHDNKVKTRLINLFLFIYLQSFYKVTINKFHKLGDHSRSAMLLK